MKIKKVLVIGMDGADWNILGPLLHEGKVPNIKSLMAGSFHGKLKSTVPPISSAAWTSFSTGVWPEKHHMLDFSVRDIDSYSARIVSSNDVDSTRLWDELAKHDKQSIVINVPLTFPSRPLNGCMISGFPTIDESEHFAYPESLVAELIKERIDPSFHPKAGLDIEDKFLKEVLENNDNLQKTNLFLIKNKPWDVFITVFNIPDALGHIFWKYKDEQHPKNTPKLFQKYGHVLDQAYIKLDDYIGDILKQVDLNETAVILLSDHGFTSTYYLVSINKWLLDNKYLFLKNTPFTSLKKILFKMDVDLSLIYKLLGFLHISGRIKKKLYKKSKFMSIGASIMLGQGDIDWSRTQAYSFGNFGQIFLNLKGRESEGQVTIEDYPQILRKIKHELMDLKDPKTGKLIFDMVLQSKVNPLDKSVYMIPDLLCMDAQMKYVSSRFFEFGSNKLVINHPVWGGTHTQYGIYLLHLPELGKSTEKDADIVDIFPTIMKLFGIDSSAVDGTSII